jgi:hypothetical protein
MSASDESLEVSALASLKGSSSVVISVRSLDVDELVVASNGKPNPTDGPEGGAGGDGSANAPKVDPTASVANVGVGMSSTGMILTANVVDGIRLSSNSAKKAPEIAPIKGENMADAIPFGVKLSFNPVIPFQPASIVALFMIKSFIFALHVSTRVSK